MAKSDHSPTLESIKEKLGEFRDQRDWSQFHNPKDLALAISIEANELLELFLWKESKDVDKERVKEELADVLSYCLYLAMKFDLDIFEIVDQKIDLNAKKYPVAKAKGSAKKYNEL